MAERDADLPRGSVAVTTRLAIGVALVLYLAVELWWATGDGR